MNKNKTVIGLTGGIATGKSEVAGIWKELGADIVNADAISRRIAEPDGCAYKPLKAAFPQAFESGVLNRRTLRTIVFSDGQKRLLLNQITHPLIALEAQAQIDASMARIVVLEAPLLFEAGFERFADVTVCTVCNRKTQTERLCARDRCNPEQAEQIIKSQMDTEKKAALCDVVLDTDVPYEELKDRAEKLYTRLLG